MNPNASEYERLSAYVDGQLPSAERASVEAMLVSDAEARRLVEDLRRLSAAMKALPSVPLGVDLSDQIMAALPPKARGESAADLPSPGGPPWLVFAKRFIRPRTIAWTSAMIIVAIYLSLNDPTWRGRPVPDVAVAPETAQDKSTGESLTQEQQKRSMPQMSAAPDDRPVAPLAERKAEEAPAASFEKTLLGNIHAKARDAMDAESRREGQLADRQSGDRGGGEQMRGGGMGLDESGAAAPASKPAAPPLAPPPAIALSRTSPPGGKVAEEPAAAKSRLAMRMAPMAAPMSASTAAPKTPAESTVVDDLSKKKETAKQAAVLPLVRVECQVAADQVAAVEKLLAGTFKRSQAESLRKDTDSYSDSHQFEGEANRSDLVAALQQLQAVPGNRVTTAFESLDRVSSRELNAPAVGGQPSQDQDGAFQQAQGGVKFDQKSDQKPASQSISGLGFSMKAADEMQEADKPQPAKPADGIDASRTESGKFAGRAMAAGPAPAAEHAAQSYRVVVVVRPLPIADAAARIASPAAKAEAQPAAEPSPKK